MEFQLVTVATTLLQRPNPGNHYGPDTSLLNGTTSTHEDGMAPLALDECGFPIDFSTTDWLQGGNMVLWNATLGGTFPWDSRYFETNPDRSSGFDPEYIMQHMTDSAPTAACMATGTKMSGAMISVDLYEEEVSTLVEDAMRCGKAGGVVTSVPVFHATPGAFILHTNNRNRRAALQRSFLQVNPTYANGVCGGNYHPTFETLESMRTGALKKKWTLLEQKNTIAAKVSCCDL